MSILIKPHSVILFQGDSITDAGRSRRAIGPNNKDGLGNGYPQLISEHLWEDYPEHHLQIYNRGLSGDQIRDLAQRWQNDSLRLIPDIISLLIGVNDTWNYLYLGMGSNPQDYQKVYRKLLQDTRQWLPDSQFVLCEPFALITGEVTGEWMSDINHRQEITRGLAREFNGVFVPFQSALDKAAENISPPGLLEDGVHPTALGHRILADCWVKAVLR
ncbi:MAG: lysophospholipase [Bacteroidetes bacterium]|nr:MAG: lysophospholipase [Bacteroidota bacterium]